MLPLPATDLPPPLPALQPVGNYWINVATLTGRNSPAVLSYVGAPAWESDPKLGRPTLLLGCDWALPEAGVYDFKNQTLLPASDVPAPPKEANQAHVVYLTLNSDPAYSQPLEVGGQQLSKQSLNMDPEVTPLSGCPLLENGAQSAYCEWRRVRGCRR